MAGAIPVLYQRRALLDYNPGKVGIERENIAVQVVIYYLDDPAGYEVIWTDGDSMVIHYGETEFKIRIGWLVEKAEFRLEVPEIDPESSRYFSFKEPWWKRERHYEKMDITPYPEWYEHLRQIRSNPAR